MKRIKLTDEELAIAMWVYIYFKIASFNVLEDNTVAITKWKFDFLRAHGYGKDYWYNACLLCQRYCNEVRKCKCPLSENGLDCGYDSSYGKVTRYYINEWTNKEALKSCKKIIKVMVREARKSEMEGSKKGRQIRKTT